MRGDRNSPAFDAHCQLTSPFSVSGGSSWTGGQSSLTAAARPGVPASSPTSAVASSFGSRSSPSPFRSPGQVWNTGGLQPSVRLAGAPFPLERRLLRAEYNHRRSKGLCYNCDERWSPVHQCKHLFLLVLDDSVGGAFETLFSELDNDNPEISLHDMTGTNHAQTMQVQLFVADTPVTALIDSGSTHNFVNKCTAKRLSLQVTEYLGLQVAVANGEQIPGSGVCNNVRIMKDDQSFLVNLSVIPLAGFELILGVKWLRTLGAILWDFTALTMRFSIDAKSITWREEHVQRQQALRTLSALPTQTAALEHILTNFSDLFQELTALPPPRSCDHRITLAKGVDPVAVRPYRFPHAQKDEIEKQCDSILALRLIRPSHSPYSSLVLLVLKHDKSWRFCVDYRELNAKTIKDKFPIPVIDEHLDEVHGSRFFTKLDLHSGYHQIRMHPDDIEKTAFRTHHDNFEFLVMPFGLCNVPSTFEALMNEVFGPLLGKFVLVFFL